ncbi:MAG: hypothetical protein KBS59_05365 [Clostridiales bacterium]|nr:hypothetical protein [Clostridiales bacterium]
MLILFLLFEVYVTWMFYKKLGHEGWEGFVPFYNVFVLFKELYGNGFKFLLLLIPFYNIYVVIKFALDVAKAFHKNTAFGFGVLLAPYIFVVILALGDTTFKDSTYSGEKLSEKLKNFIISIKNS